MAMRRRSIEARMLRGTKRAGEGGEIKTVVDATSSRRKETTGPRLACLMIMADTATCPTMPSVARCCDR